MKGQQQPPQWAIDFLEWFCPTPLFEGVLGDLLEQFDYDVEVHGSKKGRRLFIWNVIRFFRPGIILRNNFKLKIINTIMLSSYFKVAIRNIRKRKMYSFINAFGLSIGIAFCILIYLFIQDEKSFDQFHTNKAQIFRIDEKTYDTWQREPGQMYRRSAYLQTGLMQVLKDELPEVVMGTRFNSGGKGIFKYEDKIFTEEITYVDKDFFKMFSFPLIKGNPDKLFDGKYEAVITPDIAKKYFGDDDPIGKNIEIDVEGNATYTVTAVIEKAPANSSLNYKVLIPQQNRPYYDRNVNQWGNYSTPTFVQLVPGADLAQFHANLQKIVEKYMGEDLKQWRERAGNVPDDVKMLELETTNLADMHLNTLVSWDKVSDPQYSLILGGIAVLILLIACINYISLALTTSTARRTEVGIRKAVGAKKGQLVSQFGFESIALAVISMIIALGLVVLFLPSFNQFTNKAIQLTYANLPGLVAVSLGISLLIGLIAGSYPALFLSSFRPVQVLKGGFSKLRTGFTKPLVVLQFALSAFLIISSVIMYRQMQYVTTKDLGYNKDQVVVIPTQTGWNEKANKMVARFRQHMSHEPLVSAVTGTSSSFNQGWSRYGYDIDGEQKYAYVYAVDPYYVPALEMKLVEGRNFDPAIASDSNAVIVNEALVRDMGWKEPLSERLNWREDSTSLGAKVIGVVKDYHFLSLERDIEPMFLTMDKKDAGYLTTMLVKINGKDIPEAIDKLRTAWNQLAPDKPFDYTFMDEDVAKQYASYKRWMSIMGLATAFAILISCLGLFGLAGINAVNRTKEIGIRKVMGAELVNIFVLLNKQYFWLALIAFVLAAPLSWYVMDQWLSDFKFAISMSWELFAVSMLAGLLVALLTVSYHAVKAATVNPAETLKYE